MRSGTHSLSCPLCHLRYAYRSELEVHVREDHAPPSAPEGRETILVRPAARRRSQAVRTP